MLGGLIRAYVEYPGRFLDLNLQVRPYYVLEHILD